MDVVFACTGNICRSPMAEALLRHRLASVAPHVTVGSVGLTFDGRPAERGAVKAMARRGIELEGFRSRIAAAEHLVDASLVIGMELYHVREISVLAPDLFPRTFTLPELVARAASAGPRRADEGLGAWVARVGEGRRPADFLGVDRDLEIADPMGRSGRAFRACADTLEELIDRLVELAWPPRAVATDTIETNHGGIHADRHRR